MRDFAVIVAMDINRGISRHGELPWFLPEDIQNFYRVTTQTPEQHLQNACVMDLETWDRLDIQPLPGRINAIIHDQEIDDLPEGVLLFHSLEDALAAFSTSDKINQVFVLGGLNLYQEATAHPNLKRLYVTKVEGDFDCDQFFPDNIPAEFEVLSATEVMEDNGIEYEFLIIGA